MRPWMMVVVLLAAGCASRSTDDWLQQLKDPDVVKRRQAIRELEPRTAEVQQIVPALVEVLRDENPYVRHDAATVLGMFGPAAQPAVPNLVATLRDKEPRVRTAAATALKKIDPQAATKAGIR